MKCAEMDRALNPLATLGGIPQLLVQRVGCRCQPSHNRNTSALTLVDRARIPQTVSGAKAEAPG